MRLIDALYYALMSPHGIVLRTTDFAKARAQLYTLRAELGDESLSILSFREGPNGELWIVRQGRGPAPSPQADLSLGTENEHKAAS